MSLFADWQGKITLPPTPLDKTVIGKNTIFQQAFRGGCFRASVSPSEIKGYVVVKTKLHPPFDALLLRLKGTRRTETKYLVLSAPDLDEVGDLTSDTQLLWDDISLLAENFGTPEQILESWKDRFIFREEDPNAGTSGLRPPQFGALHAIVAHFSVGKDFEPATVVLPTGTGKTETMLSLQVYKRLQRTLIIVPSDTLRTQIANKFVSLGILADVGVVPHELIGPAVAKLTTGITSAQDAEALVQNANVIVALPQTLSASSAEARETLANLCTDLIVDEAHHVPASQWSKVRELFANKRITQFTATPFRSDNRRIDGKIVFNFKLGDAQAADYYRPVNLQTIEEFGDEETRDRRIAEVAIELLRYDRDTRGQDHILMARCKSQTRAESLFALYNDLAPEMNPQLIFSGPGRTKKNQEALDRLMNRGENSSHLVICVDMLGEGFDLPNLKIAALHDVHKSLAITLQFVGRFTRKGNWEQVGEATVVANIADPETETKLEALYSEGADWDGLIRRLSEERIDEELQLQTVIHNLREHGNLHAHLSLWNLRPSLSTQIFRTRCAEWSPQNYTTILASDAESWHSISDDDAVLVAVTHRNTRVRWGKYQNLHDAKYDLIVARWDKENAALFVYTSDYDGLKSTVLANSITDTETTLLQGPVIFNILNNVELPLVKNLGSSRIGAISFTSYFGPNVTDGLASIEQRESTLNNIACVGYEGGERVLWGGTQRRGKVWQQASGTISHWIDWTKHTWTKVSAEEEVETNITRNFLRPKKLPEPYDEHPISIQWGEQAQAGFSDRQFIVFDTIEVPLFLIELEITEVDDQGGVTFRLSCDANTSEYRFCIDEKVPAGYTYEKVSGPNTFFCRGNGPKIEVTEYFISDPIIVRYADGTYSYNCYHIPIQLNAGVYPRERLEIWSWDNIPLNRESIGKDGDQNTIQYQSFLNIADEYELVFNDDGKGEAGDLVCLKDVDNSTIKLCLVHCKGAKDGQVSNDIRNFYTVCGQAQKSITIKHLGIGRLYLDLKRRHEIWARQGCSRFLKGDMKLLSYFKDKARRSKITFEVVIVQPGGSKPSISEDILKLLGTTELFLKTTAQGELRVIVSP